MIRSVALAAWLSLSIVACAIPLDPVPEIVEVDLGDRPIVDREEAGDLVAVPLYLVEDGSITSVTRDLAPPADVTSVLGSLLRGTTEPEERTGLRTSIPSGTRLLAMDRDGSTVRLDISRDFAAVGGEEELLAVAQIVLTATEIEGVDSVLFELEGVPTDVPLPNGALSDRPVSAANYRTLLTR